MKIKSTYLLFLFKKKLLIIMVRSFIFLFCTSLLSFTPSNILSQNTKIIINTDKVLTVDEIFDLIMDQTDYTFIYQIDMFKDFPKVPLKKGVIGTNQLLKKSLVSEVFNFEFTNSNTIVLKEKEEEPVYVDVQDQQKRIITGTVTDIGNVPLPGVNIIKEGTSTGAQTDFDGNYTINANKGDVLEFSYIGMKTLKITVGDDDVINVILKEDAALLEEVVVTALGIRKERRKVGFATQEVAGEALTKAQPPSFVEGLTGKVAGVIVTNNSADFFSDPQIYLRGERPLIVVDGVPQPNSDFWNLSSDDIESITVLKGAAASALYGSLGKNGALQVTMKTGKGKQGTVITYNTSNTFQTGFLRIPHAQTEYGPGNNGIYRYGGGIAGGDGLTLGGGQNDVDHSIWGPKFDGRLIEQFDSPIDPETGYRIPTPWISRGEDNLKNFMDVGVVSTHNVTVQSNFERGYFAISDTYRYSKASTPGQRLDINTIRLAGHLDISDKASVDGSLQFNHQNSDNRIRGVYGPTSPLYNLTIWGGAHYDVRNFRQVWQEGKEGIAQNFVEKWRFNNPYALAHAWKRPWIKNDILTYLKFNYKFSDNLNIHVRSTLNSYDLTNNEEISKDIYNYDIPDRGGRFRYNHTRYFENNTDFLLSYNQKFFNGDFGIDATLGANQRYLKTVSESASTTQLIVPEIFTLQNSVDPVTPNSSTAYKGVYSGYASFDLSYKNLLFVGATARIDKSSTLIKGNDSFFYPSVYMSAVLSDAFEMPDFISFLKVRTAYASVGDDFGIFEATNEFGTGRWRNIPTASYPSRLENPDLRPEFNASVEYGAELKLFNGRFGIDFSYYENTFGPQIFTQSFSSASGYSGILQNGRKTETRGFDASISVVPVRTDDFEWSMLFNVDKYTRYLISLPPLEDGTIPEREGRTFVGGELNHYWWNTWDRTADGQLIIGPNGLPVSTPAIDLGNTQPDFTASFNNTIRYKNWSMNFLIDGRFGGITFDRYERDLWRSGSHPESVHPERDLSNIAFATGGDARTMLIPGMQVVSGDVTWDPDGNVIEDTREFVPNETKVNYQQWAQGYMGDWRSNIIEKTFAKLREASVTYTFPRKMLENTFIKAASISVVGRNLLYWTKDDTYGDLDTYTLSTGDTNLQQPSQRSFGFNVNLQF
ncbi:SusC/RagA family TonB-linked outer membrane protein [Snuella lapsa]